MSNVAPTNPSQMTRTTEIIRTTGNVQMVLSDSEPHIVLDTQHGSKVVMGATGITIDAPGVNIRIQGGEVKISAAIIKLDAAIVTAQMIRCDTIVAQSVIGASYTPGAGNVW